VYCIYFSLFPCHRDLHSFPTRRSSDLGVRSTADHCGFSRSPCPEAPSAPGCMLGRPARNTTGHRESLLREEAQVERERKGIRARSEEHTSELQSRENLVCRLLLEKKK